MGDTGEDFEAFNAHKRAVRAKVEPGRLSYACDKLKDYRYSPGGDCLHIHLPRGVVTFWPYTGWFCGRKPYGKVKGRGIDNLMKQLKGVSNE
jgi:hypothetical protein